MPCIYFTDVVTDECTSNPCLNGGTYKDGRTSYICICTEGYIGLRCEYWNDTIYRSPAGWTGPLPSVYRSFDAPERLSLMSGSVHSKNDVSVTGKVKITISFT